MIALKKFSRVEIETAKAALPMGLCFITEGVLPFAAADPIRFIISSVLGSSTAGSIAFGFGVECPAAYGGMFVVPMMKYPIWFITALTIRSLIAGVTYAALKRTNTKLDNNDENELDNVRYKYW